jgi:glutamate synthase (NADPH) small chain
MEKDRLRELEEKCIQECAPPCAAACPVHVDMRSVTGYIARGDFNAALKLLQKTLPFPVIIGNICDQPCRAVCNRSRSGGAIEIAALERACAVTAGAPPAKILVLPARGKSVAIIGGGLSGLTAAFDLRKKGCAVTVFEKEARLGGSIRKMCGDRLSAGQIDCELTVIADMGIEIRLNTKADPNALSGFDAVYAAVGASGPSDYTSIDPLTYATARKGLFAGGSLLRSPGNYSPILSVADGRRAAISIDRYLQNVSLTASRAGEGSLESCLYTNMEAVLSSEAPAVPENGFTAQGAVREAGRCLQCQCLECVKVCRYLESFGAYPRKYVREMYNNLSIVMGVRQSNTLTNSCSLCGLCAEVCPNDLNMAGVCSDARRTMVSQKRMPPSAHDFALRDMLFANSDACSLSRPAPGTTASDYLFFPGCQLSASAPEHVEKTYAFLRQNLKGSVGLMLRCCGAPADWAGRDDLFGQALDEFCALHRSLGSPRVVLACPSCSRTFQARLPDIPIMSLWEVVAEAGLPATACRASGRTVSIHDPCAARHDSGLHERVRSIAQGLGYAVKELALSRQKTTCCSYGGLQWFANNRLAQETILRRVRENGLDYLTYCSMCRDLFAGQGKRCLHLLDLLFERDVEVRSTRPCPDWSQRRGNRQQLKQRLLKDCWTEVITGHSAEPPPRLIISPPVRAVLEQRLILDDDIRQVISHGETTGRKLRHAETGRFLAGHKQGSVTYWAEYNPVGDGYEIFTAYSHRMEIVADKISASGQADPDKKPGWLCAACDAGLKQRKVEIAYLGSAFPVELFCCAACGIVYIPEELALKRMAEAEKILEDK